MIHHIPLTKARINLGALIKAVHLHHDCIVLEKDGYPVAGILNIDELEDYLETRDSKTQKDISRSHQDFTRGDYKTIQETLQKLSQT